MSRSASMKTRIAMWLVFVATPPIAGRLLLDPLLGLRCNPILCAALGAALLGLAVRAAAVTGRYLAVYGEARRGVPRRLVTVGPYSCMRHPMHLFLSLVPVASGLLAASPGGALLGLVFAAAVLVFAVTVDEAEARRLFGEAYEEYRRRVPAFNLDPRCLAKALGPRPPRRRG